MEQTHRDGSEPVYALSEVLASCQKDYAVVALRGEEVVGACVGRAAHEQGWIVFCATKEGLEGRGIGPAMLAALEKRMSSHRSRCGRTAQTGIGARRRPGA